MSAEIQALIWSYLYIGIIVGMGEGAKRAGLSTEISRKIIHVGVGLWIFGTLALFTNPYMAVIPPLTAAVGNYVIHRKQLLKAVEAEPDNLGTVWFPISFAILILALWRYPLAMAGGVMAMTIGDAVAAAVGIRWGRRKYATLGGKLKSLEGSLAMFISTLVAVWLTVGRIAPAAFAAVVATCVEALGIKGRDNLWVPLSAGGALYLCAIMPGHYVGSLALGAVLAGAIGIAAWMKGSLTPSGVLGAILTGTLLFGVGGWVGGLALMGFFVSSSALSKLFRARKAEVEAEYDKSGTRDLGQALANGGVAALAALLLGLTGEGRYVGAMLGALAAANADTWATELGVLSRTAPRMITSLRTAAPGTSGAISLAGTGAALVGAAFIGVMGALGDRSLWHLVPWIAFAGLTGALFDSLLGATLQAIRWCPTCSKETERKVHRCGTATALHRGLPWLDNDMVNALATLAGAAIGYLVM